MLFQNVISRYRIIAKNWSDETCWTCFGYEDFTPDELHCTHKFFGEQAPETIKEIEKVIDEYFAVHPFQSFAVEFDTEEWFGENRDIRVLRPSKRHDFLPDLRAKLDAFAEDSHPEYKPHVTTDQPKIDLPLVRYCLCSKIIHQT